MEQPNVELLIVLPKIPTCTFINFQEIFLPIRLFSPIFLLIFEEISHLYFYSDSSSIRNSRVITTGTPGFSDLLTALLYSFYQICSFYFVQN